MWVLRLLNQEGDSIGRWCGGGSFAGYKVWFLMVGGMTLVVVSRYSREGSEMGKEVKCNKAIDGCRKKDETDVCTTLLKGAPLQGSIIVVTRISLE